MQDPFNQLLKYPNKIPEDEFILNLMEKIRKKQRLRQTIIALTTLFSLILVMLMDVSIDLSPVHSILDRIQHSAFELEMASVTTQINVIVSILMLAGLSIWIWLIES